MSALVKVWTSSICVLGLAAGSLFASSNPAWSEDSTSTSRISEPVAYVPDVSPSSELDPDLSWPPLLGAPGQIGITVEDYWMLQSAIRVSSPGGQPICYSMDDPVCAELAEQYGWWILRVAPPCAQALAWEECVEGLAIKSGGLPFRDLQLIGTAPGTTFDPDESRGLPTGSTMSLFQDPADPSLRYAAYLGGQMGSPQNPFYLGEFSAQVIPYRTVPMGMQPGSGGCLFTSEGRCSYRAPFPEDSTFQMSMRLRKQMTGWLGGRLADPTLEVQPWSDTLNKLTVTANPVGVPLVAVAIPVSEASPEIMDYWRENFTCAGNVPCTSGVMHGRSGGFDPQQLELFAEPLGQTATKVIPTWSVSSLPTGPGRGQPCLFSTTRVVGLVTTNATVYDSSPPSFTEGSLRYKVAGLHRIPGGAVFEGSYNLLLRSDAARCLYRFSDAPIKAEISVTSQDGVEQVATTSVSEKDGWLKLGAYGFTFSQPTISVTLTSEEATTQSIVCKKGKKRTLVTGVSPACPDGWKQVSSKRKFVINCVKQDSTIEGPRKVKVKGTERTPPQCPAGYQLRR